MKSLKAKLALLLFAMAALSVLPAQLRADGNPFPACNGQICVPPGTN
ncbi:MAG: hypothetical protein WAK13_11005 [Terriglobales bacterium]